MVHRQTILREITIEGVGLHSGRSIRMTLTPADAGTGVVFVRIDEGGVTIPATLDFSARSLYATVIRKGEVTVTTIEHLMAALYALQVDDVRVELDGPEVPVIDGSSRPFVDAIQEAGLTELKTVRQYLTVVRPIVVTEEEDKEKKIGVYPCSEYRVTYAIDFDHPHLGYQELTASLWSTESFVEKLAPARTFILDRDVDAVKRAGLAKGGTLGNTILVGDAGIENPPLRFPDEFVRHKMLDLTGDLSLIGYPLRGHVVAYRAGHDLHSRMAHRIRDARECWYLAPWFEQTPRDAPTAAGREDA